VFAILYALLVIVILGVAATVVDLALMREGRATLRSAADSAAVAGASALNPIDPSRTDPRQACLKAWAYLANAIPELGAPGTTCNSFPTAPSALCNDTTAAIAATKATAEYEVRITWPVKAASSLMTQPDVRPGSVSQAADVTFDGANPCDRVGVEVSRSTRTVFASALGVGRTTVGSASVGRAVQQGESKDVIAALNILEPSKCAALTTSGQGSVEVDGVDDQAGFIAVESSGTGGGPACNGQGATIEAASNALNFIRADGPQGDGTGLIQSFALNPSPKGNPVKAFNSGPILPTPTMLAERYGAKPVLDIFNCSGASCAPGGSTWISQLVAMYGGAGAPTHVWPSSPQATDFKTLTSDLVSGFTCNGTASTPPIIVPPGNWYVDCPSGFKVSGLVVFQGGHVVTSGPVELGSSSACLAINVPVTTSTCPTADTAPDPDTTSPAPTSDSILYIRSGRLYKVSQAQLYLPRTFTYLQDGYTDLAGGSGALLMTTPLADESSCTTDACRNQHFRRLVLWSEGTSEHAIGGQSSLVLRGVLFTPNAPSTFTGQAGQQQADAQFWTRTLEVKGQGTLVMAADPEASIARPLLGVSLIR
jgi:hypothetical protein